MHALRATTRRLCCLALCCLLPVAGLAAPQRPACDGSAGALPGIQEAQACNEQALALHAQGEYAQAAARYEAILPAITAHFGDDSREVAHVLSGLADTLAARQQYAQAEQVYDRALIIYAAHDDRLAQAGVLNGQAAAFYMRRQYGRAEPLFRRALELLEAERGDVHADLVPVLENLAALYQTLRRDDRAQAYQQRVRAVREALAAEVR